MRGFITKNVAKNILLLLFGFILAFTAIEIYLRVFDNPFDFRIRGNKIALPIHRTYEIHNTEIPKLDEFIIHEKNSLGFRGQEPPEAFEEYLTIVTIGGSTTESFYMSEGETWTDKLGSRLEDNFTKIWINNAGLDGTSTFGHIVLMEDYVVRLKPKVVLFLIGLNDVGRDDLSRYDDDILKPTPKLTDPVRDFILKSSEFAVLAYNLTWHMQTRNQQVGHSAIIFEALPVVEISKQEALQVKQDHQENYLESYQVRVEHLVEIARANNMEPVFITQPAVYGNALDSTTGVDLAKISVNEVNGKVQWEILNMYNDVTRQVGVENNILVIDLAYQLEKDSKYYYDFVHYTKEGSHRIAEIIYTELCPFLTKKYSSHVIRECAEN